MNLRGCWACVRPNYGSWPALRARSRDNLTTLWCPGLFAFVDCAMLISRLNLIYSELIYPISNIVLPLAFQDHSIFYASSNDIHLGDVVVSQPGPQYGGVVQHDMGKCTQDVWLCTSAVASPPADLLFAAQILQREHRAGRDPMPQYISQVSQKLPGYRFPGRQHDNLMAPGGRHQVQRLQRQSNTPAVHHGLIGSCGTAMTSGTARDKLRDRHCMLCVDTESAGVMNHFPCLVVRGVRDYMDEYRSEVWQPYAALAAAAYVKDLLRCVPASWC